MNFVICGLPRSGTTIIARFIGGLPGVHVEHEPYQRAVKFGRFPPELNSKNNYYEHYGFKEPFWGIDEGCQFRNDSVLKAHRACGWRFIFVVREEEAIWKSISMWGITRTEFVENHRRFLNFMYDSMPLLQIQYEKFCECPALYWNELLLLPVIAKEVNLAPSPTTERMGDERAFNSTEICRT